MVIRIHGSVDDVTVGQLHGRVGQLRLDQLTVVVHLGACDFINLRGFRALLQLQEHVSLLQGRLLVLDPPRTLQILCAAAPGRLTLVPDSTATAWPELVA